MRISDWSSDVCSSDLGRRGEAVAADAEDGKPARTLYQVVQSHGKAATWLVLLPLTGRTHQLRVHCAALGTPIVGDGKSGGRAAFPAKLAKAAPAPKTRPLLAREPALSDPGAGTPPDRQREHGE